MLFLQIGFKQNWDMDLNVIQLQFLQMCLSPDALAAHIRFKSACSQCGTQRQLQLQSHGSLSERLCRIHAATSRVVH